MKLDTTTEDIICTASCALNELFELTNAYEMETGGTGAGSEGLPVSNLIHCIQTVLNEALNTLEAEQTHKPSTKNKIKAIAA